MATNLEEKVDMSLDELVSLRRANEKKEGKATFSLGKNEGGSRRRRSKRRAVAKAASPTVDKAAVQQASGRLKRVNQIAKRRGLAAKIETPNETQKRAQKTVKIKTTTVNLGKKSVKAKQRGAATSNASVPKTFSIEPTTTSRPVSIKDFVLPKDTKMTISFTSKTATAAAKTTAATTKTAKTASNATTAATARRTANAKNAKVGRAAKVAQARDMMDTSSDKQKKTRRSRRTAA